MAMYALAGEHTWAGACRYALGLMIRYVGQSNGHAQVKRVSAQPTLRKGKEGNRERIPNIWK